MHLISILLRRNGYVPGEVSRRSENRGTGKPSVAFVCVRVFVCLSVCLYVIVSFCHSVILPFCHSVFLSVSFSVSISVHCMNQTWPRPEPANVSGNSHITLRSTIFFHPS